MRHVRAAVRWRVAFVLCGLLAVATAATAQMRDWPLERPPGPLPARDVQFPPYEMRTLPNGMQVIAVSHHEQPVVSVRLLVRAGAAQDPEGKGGAGSLVAALLDQGTTSRNAQEIADQIDFIGGALGAGAGADLSFVNVVVMKDSFGVGMDLLADVVRNPAFASEEIDRQKQQAISSLEVSARDPEYLASAVFDRLVYGFHPYGLPGTGTLESIARITRDDLQAFHRRYFVPNNMILAIVGDVTAAEAFAGAERVFGAWPRVEVPAVRPVEPPPPTRRLVVVDKPDAVQTEIRVGTLAIPRSHPDYMAWDLAVKILGGEGANRLHGVLRTQRGLTYGASASTEARKQSGDVIAETNTRTETTAQALKLTVDEFARLVRDRVGLRELSDAQAYQSGTFPLTIETPNEIATQILNVLFYDRPVSEIPTFRERVMAVTPDDVQRVAREYIKPERLSIVLVGNARGFVRQLSEFGFPTYEVIPIEELDLTSASLRREKGRPAAAGAPSRQRLDAASATAFQRKGTAASKAPAESPAAALVRQVIEAHGGLAALRAVKTVVAEAETVLHLEQGPLRSMTTTSVRYPDRVRVDARVGGTAVAQVYSAGEAWVQEPGGTREVADPMRAEFAASVQRDIVAVLVALGDGTVTATSRPDETRDGATFRVLEVTGTGRAPLKLLVDAAGLVAREVYTIAGPDGRTVEAEERFSDYQTAEGVRLAYTAAVRADGRPVVDRTLKSLAINGTLDDALFVRRP